MVKTNQKELRDDKNIGLKLIEQFMYPIQKFLQNSNLFLDCGENKTQSFNDQLV